MKHKKIIHQTYVVFDSSETKPPFHLYVGKTCRGIDVRMREHWKSVYNGNTGHVQNWMRSRRKKDIKIVACGTFDTLKESLHDEERLITFYWKLGYRITNTARGGVDSWSDWIQKPAMLPQLPKKRPPGRPKKEGRMVGWRKDGNHVPGRRKRDRRKVVIPKRPAPVLDHAIEVRAVDGRMKSPGSTCHGLYLQGRSIQSIAHLVYGDTSDRTRRLVSNNVYYHNVKKKK